MIKAPSPIFPSILSSNYFNLESRLQTFVAHGVEFIHLDVMDGHFVNNLSFGPAAVKAIKSQFPLKVDAHLMVDQPERMIPWFLDAGADWVSFHLEVPGNVSYNIAQIKERGARVGLALNPDMPIERVFPYLATIDYVLLMSVFPGYGGQKFIPATLERVTQLKQQIAHLNAPCLIQVDGGINTEHAAQLCLAGADLFVIGTFLYNAENIAKTIEDVLNSIHKFDS